MKITEIKYLEWNLHAMGGKGYQLPTFIPEYIEKVDIFVLVEFCAANGWQEFRNELEKNFDLYCSPYVSKEYNQVCIGMRKSMGYELLSVVSADVCDVNVPEVLEVDIKIGNKALSIIGTRIKTEAGTKQAQYDYLKKHLGKLDSFLCLGDFNCVYNHLSKQFSSVADIGVYGPRITNGYHSFVFKNGDACGLDWLLAKGLDSIYNGYEDSSQSPTATYDWSFITSQNGYKDKTEYDFLGIRGLPDHAILKGMVKIL